jgi:tungstate transport system ATP-binding protein
MEIRLENVWHSYNGASYALKNINLVFRDPGVYIVVGPNGSGKTTLLKILTLILKPSKGRVIVDGEDFWSLTDDKKQIIRRLVAYVHDKPILLHNTVKYNIELGLKLRGENREKEVLEYASRYGLIEALEKPAHILSAGQAKAVSIIRALLLKPKLLALDEPFSFLDSTRTRLVLEDIRLLVEKGSMIIISTHYTYKDLMKIANNVIEIINGEILSNVKGGVEAIPP